MRKWLSENRSPIFWLGCFFAGVPLAIILGSYVGPCEKQRTFVDVRCYGAHSEIADDAELIKEAIAAAEEPNEIYLTTGRVFITSLDDVTAKDEPLAAITDDMIRELGKSGRICEMFGHWWDETDLYLDYHPGMQHRTCKICGKYQSRKWTDWK